MIGDFVKGMDADNSTMHAMQEHFTEHWDKVPEKVIPFSSTVKYSGVIFKDQAYVLGAPEFVLRDDYEKYKEDEYKIVLSKSISKKLDQEVINVVVNGKNKAFKVNYEGKKIEYKI